MARLPCVTSASNSLFFEESVMRAFAKLMEGFWKDEQGLEMVEYAVVAFAIIVAAYAIF
jgi:Flp pilus assembly protein TadG